MKIHTLRFALAGGITLAVCYALATIASLLAIPGFPPFAQLLVVFYGPWGYSVSLLGIVVGALWGFVEGFVWVGIFALVYGWLVRRNQ